MKDSRDDAADELRKVIRSKAKKEFKGLADRLEEYLESETGVKKSGKPGNTFCLTGRQLS
jgi:hypothetical protein